MSIDLKQIKHAREQISDFVVNTRQRVSHTLSALLECNIYLKFENRQYTASFKERGALIKLKSLSVKERENGVVAMSAGNHAQGLSYHGARLGVPVHIIMPLNTPTVKVEHTKAHGANVILFGETLAEAAEYAQHKAVAENLTFIHPYDDPHIITGQGTVALEMLDEIPHLDTMIIPIGGGGLISGMAIAAKSINPTLKVFGVQTSLYPSMQQVLKGEEPICGGSTIAEGIAVKYPGFITRDIIQEYVEDILLVSEDEIEQAISLLINIEKTVVEGAGAAGLAALLAHREQFKGKNVGLVLSGGNIDQRLLSNVLMRDLARSGRLAQLRVHLIDRPGALAEVSHIIGNNGGNIVEISHQRVFTHVPAKDTSIEIVVETKDKKQLNHIMANLENADFPVVLLS